MHGEKVLYVAKVKQGRLLSAHDALGRAKTVFKIMEVLYNGYFSFSG